MLFGIIQKSVTTSFVPFLLIFFNIVFRFIC
nr:MAG TPA: hypothetical protein [Caudoviricetes sp.]